MTDTLPAIALGVEPAEPDVMDREPIDKKYPSYKVKIGFRILTVGAAEAILALIAFFNWRKRCDRNHYGVLNSSPYPNYLLLLVFKANDIVSLKFKLVSHPVLWLAF